MLVRAVAVASLAASSFREAVVRFLARQRRADPAMVDVGKERRQRIIGVETVDQVRRFLFCRGGPGDETGMADLMKSLQLLLHGKQLFQPFQARGHGVTSRW